MKAEEKLQSGLQESRLYVLEVHKWVRVRANLYLVGIQTKKRGKVKEKCKNWIYLAETSFHH